MNEPARPGPDAAEGPGSAGWVASLPPPPFVVKPDDGSPPRFAPWSPRVAVLLVAAIVVGILLWMARDSVRPFVVGLLLVYLLDMPVRWLVRRGLRRSLAIVLVYVATVVVVVEFLALTLTPLVNEILRFIEDFPKLAESLNARLQDLTELYSRLEIPPAIRDWIDGLIAGIGQGGEVGAGMDLSFLLPLVTGAGSLIGAIFGYVLLPVWVFYLLKDRVSLAASFDKALPATWRFDTMVVLRSVERVLSQWVRAQFVLGVTVGVFTFIGLLILSRFVDPIFGRYAILLSVIGRHPRAAPDHRPDHLGGARGAAGGDRRTRVGDRGADPLHAGPAGREQRARAQDPGRCRRAASRRGHVRDHHRRCARRPGRGDPCAARRRGRPRRGALPVPARWTG